MRGFHRRSAPIPYSPRAVADFFSAITRAWQVAAYARQLPASDRLLALCRQWPEAFGEAP